MTKPRPAGLPRHRLPAVLVLSVLLVSACSTGGTVADSANPTSTSTSSASTSSVSGGPIACPAPATTDLTTAAGWLGYLAAHRDDVSVLVRDSGPAGNGSQIQHQTDAALPAASAAKLVHLAAYAEAVDAAAANPDEPVSVAEWESWYLPGLDGGAHGQALQTLGIASDGVSATDPAATVRLDDLVAVMIRFSDNAAADLLRARLGDNALRSVTAAAGAPDAELPSFAGAAITLLDPTTTPGSGVPPADRDAAELVLAQRFSADPDYRAKIRALSPPGSEAQTAWAETTSTATASLLSVLHQTIYAAADDPSRPGAAAARQHLEWPPAPAGTLGLGAKGGSYPGVLTETMTLRRPDGSTATAVLMVHRMSAEDWSVAVQSFAHQELMVSAMQDPATHDLLRCSLG